MKRRQFTRTLGLGALGWMAWSGPSAAEMASGTVRGRVTVKRKRRGKVRAKRNHSGVVVYLQGVPNSKPKGRSSVIEIRQVDKHFVPSVAVTTVGTKVSFPNDDKTFHNVYSHSKAASFDLGLYKSGTTKGVKMRKPGTVEVYCNIHHDMRATVLVLDTRHYAMTGRDGSFELPDVPPGTYDYVAWTADGEPVRGKVKVTAGGTTDLDLDVTESARPRPKLDKDGNPRVGYPK